MHRRAPVAIPPDFTAPSAERTIAGDPRLYGANEKEAEGTIVVHFKVLSASADERLAVARVIETQLKTQRVGSKDVTYVITGGDDADSVLSNTSGLVSIVVAEALKALGMKR